MTHPNLDLGAERPRPCPAVVFPPDSLLRGLALPLWGSVPKSSAFAAGAARRPRVMTRSRLANCEYSNISLQFDASRRNRHGQQTWVDGRQSRGRVHIWGSLSLRGSLPLQSKQTFPHKPRAKHGKPRDQSFDLVLACSPAKLVASFSALNAGRDRNRFLGSGVYSHPKRERLTLRVCLARLCSPCLCRVRRVSLPRRRSFANHVEVSMASALCVQGRVSHLLLTVPLAMYFAILFVAPSWFR